MSAKATTEFDHHHQYSFQVAQVCFIHHAASQDIQALTRYIDEHELKRICAGYSLP